MTELYYPLHSLREGHWFKLICGASFQHLPAVRSLTLAYTLAGADCIDVAADPAVISAAKDALQVASTMGNEAKQRGFGFLGRPWLMVSLNDGEDPHFRKAEFDSDLCPGDCPRPCEKICPAQAITFQNGSEAYSGVLDQRCYGCGRCLPVCPHQLITTRSYVSAPFAIAPLILSNGVDAIEIHTKVGNLPDFKRLWNAIAPWCAQLKLLAISCPDGKDLIDYLKEIYQLIQPLPCPLIWQTDGRPMSGDIGMGTTHAAVKLAHKVIAARLPGYVQLAGGTNNHTVSKLRAAKLLNHCQVGRLPVEGSKELLKVGRLPVERSYNNLGQKATLREQPNNLPYSNPKGEQPNNLSYIAGVAYGSYARVLLSPIVEKLEQDYDKDVDHHQGFVPNPSSRNLEDVPARLWQAVATAHALVAQLKSVKKIPESI
ncbi:4Fe-4S ferredoxin [Moorena producens JHB]|uniref:4Fe-4S ferredoxin n=1 Tax=Moorena producens (strain JHB) TaxID=1454205 RepID=A0A1D9G300_MOOP1|nr:LdpA C-terminal domain-containing domain [Moorena producens]AOY81895.2 4Fe-4S ferredoxin [Moorena producens JHB]